MKIEKELQLVSLEQAKKLKELGFDWDVFFAYRIADNEFGKKSETPVDYQGKANLEDYVPAPTIALALKWFRDVEKSIATIVRGDNCYFGEVFSGDKTLMTAGRSNKLQTYEEAESALLDALIEYAEKENNVPSNKTTIDKVVNNVVQIFKDYDEFRNRPDKKVNGVTQEFLDKNELTLETLKLINCESCFNCKNCYACRNCNWCSNCRRCNVCYECNDCYECNWCEWCNNCKDCYKCYYCNDCNNCYECYDCNRCYNCEWCDKCKDCNDKIVMRRRVYNE